MYGPYSQSITIICDVDAVVNTMGAVIAIMTRVRK
eukprot:SAG22_NODE_2633_length_2353_cov_1.968500_1_plen_35_part_00